MKEISIIIVNYNTGKLLYDCLDSIRRRVDADFEVIVADNGSSDDSVSGCAEFWKDGRFRLMECYENLGFAKANNRAAAVASGRILHFLNPDTELEDGISDDYKEALLHPDALYVNPLVNRDGSPENDRMPLPLLKDLLLWNFCRRRARYWYKGASLIISSDNFRRIGGWCEDYFLYAEDLDFFYEAWRHGIPVRQLHSVIFHLGGGSSSSLWRPLEREIMVQKSNVIFFRKHFSQTQYIASKLYFLFHTLFRHPRVLPLYLRAWHAVRRQDRDLDGISENRG